MSLADDLATLNQRPSHKCQVCRFIATLDADEGAAVDAFLAAKPVNVTWPEIRDKFAAYGYDGSHDSISRHARRCQR